MPPHLHPFRSARGASHAFRQRLCDLGLTRRPAFLQLLAPLPVHDARPLCLSLTKYSISFGFRRQVRTCACASAGIRACRPPWHHSSEARALQHPSHSCPVLAPVLAILQGLLVLALHILSQQLLCCAVGLRDGAFRSDQLSCHVLVAVLRVRSSAFLVLVWLPPVDMEAFVLLQRRESSVY